MLAKTEPGKNGEIQLTDAMGALLGTRYFLQLPGANVFIRRLLIIILVVAIARLGWSLAQTTFGAA